LDVTGERAWTGDQLAGLVSEMFERQVTHLSVPPDAFRAGTIEHGLPPAIADMLTSIELGTSRGDLATPSDAVSKLTGSAPEGVASFLERHRAAFTG
jgi:NAD(P)H dehydrogenase (quinone)